VTEHFRAALFGGLAERGWVEGRNLAIEARFADGDRSRLDSLARELVALTPDLIVAPTTPGAMAVRKLTEKIPIVLVLGSDPVGAGLARSLARPGGNVTGFNLISVDVAAKRIEILREAFPSARRVAVLHDDEYQSNAIVLPQMQRAAEAMGMLLERVHVSVPETHDAAFRRLEDLRPDVAYVLATPATFIHRGEIVRRIAAARVPTIYGANAFVMSGGLMSYAVDFADNFRRAADYVDRILRGADPAVLPIQQPTRFELVINLKTAKALRIELPQAFLLRADRVIE